jgi:hypothetical protein
MELTLDKVKTACRAAYEAGTLIAQHPRCTYGYERGKNGAYHCAIGCALDRKTLNKINRTNKHSISVDDLDADDLLQINPDELPDIQDIQVAHDNWFNFVQNRCVAQIDESRAYFLKLIEFQPLTI